MYRRTLTRLTLVNVTLCLLLGMAIPAPRAEVTELRPVAVAAEVQADTDRDGLLHAELLDVAYDSLRSTDGLARVHGVRLLGALPDTDAALTELLSDAHPDVAIAAARCLDERDGRVARLRALAKSDVHDLGVVGELHETQAEGAIALTEEALGHPDPYVRGVALRSLAIRRPDLAASHLPAALRSGEDALRFQAFEAAAHCPLPGNAPLLRDAARSADSLEARLALGALVALGDADARRELLARQDAATEYEALQYAETLAVAGVAEAAPRWSEAFAALSAPQQLRALGRYAVELPTVLLPEIEALLEARDARIRFEAALLLARRGEPGRTERVCEILEQVRGPRRAEAGLAQLTVARVGG